MSVLFLTADQIDLPSGGGLVCRNEVQALRQQFGKVEVWDRTILAGGNDPWGWDEVAVRKLTTTLWLEPFTLCHFYSGSFPKTVEALKKNGCLVSYTIAAHDRHVSKREHEQLGLQFPYSHLTEELLWQKYIEGYRLADVIICPSTVAMATVRQYGPAFASKDIRVVPHGCTLPDALAPPPKRFVCGYLGSFGADKGVRYLLEAWKLLDYKDATLVLAGRDSTSNWARHLIQTYGGGNIECRGWIDDISDFFDSISLYVQSSATEGFGIEVLEAMAHGRPVLCSTGAAHEVVPWAAVEACDSTALAKRINHVRKLIEVNDVNIQPSVWQSKATNYSWNKIHEQYISVWRSML